ncbi:MAG: MlaD family protein [Rickettsiales bacterium]|jgi:phospholipid/cholesterol/gamma-HCH transport system substrate-binding protein|nr:MlaD family protein [Rickettsiales bacterium]
MIDKLKITRAFAYCFFALLFAVIIVGARRERSESRYSLSANVARSDGLKVRAAVRMSGVDVGYVDGLRLNPDFSVDVDMKLDSGVKVPEDSVAAIYTDGLLGAKYVEIIPGGAEEFLEDGGSFDYTQSAIDLSSMIERGIESAVKK